MRRTSHVLKAAAAGVALCLLAACGGTGTQAGGIALDEDGLYGSARSASAVAPEVLIDTEGNDFSFGTSLDKPLTLVFFGYTNCPDICSMVMGTIASTLKKLDAGDRAALDVVFVTSDPARDTPEVLREYLDRFDPSVIGVTAADLDTIAKVGAVYGVHVEKGEKLPSGGYAVVHSDPVVGLNSRGEATTVWLKDMGQKDLAADIKTLVNQ